MNKLMKKYTPDQSSFTEIQAYLKESNLDKKRSWLQILEKKHQKILFSQATPITNTENLIPKIVPELREVIFEGKNTLPCFNFFQKRMCYSSDKKNIWGYNHQSLQSIVGPGYFAISQPQEKLMIDYTILPKEKVPSWPNIKSNKSGLSRLVYHQLQDELRMITEDIFVGVATKNGKNLGQYFTLIRI